MKTSAHTPWASPTGVAAALDDILRRTEPGRTRPPLTYLRRKPGRGMVAVYGDAATGSVYTVTVDESAMTGEPASADSSPMPGAGTAYRWDGGLARVQDLGLTVQRFPHDESLPLLADATTPTAGTPLWRALADATAGAARLVSAEARPLRYKPGDRCVIRYRLRLETPHGAVESRTVIGKLYQTLDQAQEAAAIMDRLWRAQGSRPWCARPLGVVDGMPLVLTEDLGSSGDDLPTLAGTNVIRFGVAAGPEALDAVRRAARALAELHTSATGTAQTPVRTGTDEAGKAAKRATTIARHVPELAEATASVAGALTTALSSLPAETLRPSHGSYKPSQLLFRSGAAFVVDFDQFALADPALDVGYFLAYLRPPGLWYHRAGTRAWFESAAAAFLSAYAEAAAGRGMDPVESEGIQRRCHVYEAALLLKIAARRSNRLHSPRPGEVKALLGEVTACLARS